MTKDIGCRVRVADKLEARDFGEDENEARTPGALGQVWHVGSENGDWRIVGHDDGTIGRYYADELTELRAVKVGDKVRTAAKLTADFGFLANDSRRPNADGRVTAELTKGKDGSGAPCFYVMVEHSDGASVPYREDEFTPLGAPMVLDGLHIFLGEHFRDGMPVSAAPNDKREALFAQYGLDARSALEEGIAKGTWEVVILGGVTRYVHVRPASTETPEERGADCRKTNRDRWIALGLTDGVYPEPGFVHSEAREAVLLDACERLTGQLADAHRALDIAEATRESNGRALEVHERVDALATSRDELQAKATLVHQALDEAKVPMSNGRMLNLFERVQILIAMRDSRQWGDEPKPASRPRAGGFVHKGSGSAVYDANGHRVGGTWRTGVGWGWDANQSFAPSVVYAAADLPSEADACAACLASLRTWADVEGEESDAPKASEGFGGTRVRTLGEAVDGAHVVRLALYGFADGSEVPYLEAHETHDGARAGRVMSLSAAVHLMQNASDDEVWTIGSREKAGESK